MGNVMNIIAQIGHNQAPDAIDETIAPFADAISEAESWLDGGIVENEGQMQAVDAIAKEIRAARSAIDKARKASTEPLHKVWKDEVARWKPTEDDLDRLQKGLAAAVDGFKRKLAAAKAEAERLARADAEAKAKAAHEAAQRASDTDIEAQRAAAQATLEAEIAAKLASKAARDNDVKGMRTVWRYEITDHKALLNWIARNDRNAVTAFIEQYAATHHKQGAIDGIRSWSEKEAY